MKVLEFAFDSEDSQDYQPHSYASHCVCYTGTHDNAPLRAWLDEAPEKTREAVERAQAALEQNAPLPEEDT